MCDASEQLIATRKKALRVLRTLYAEVEDDGHRRTVLNAMLAATRTPSAGAYGSDLLGVILADSGSIVQFFTERAAVESFEMLQHIEHTFWGCIAATGPLLTDLLRLLRPTWTP